MAEETIHEFRPSWWAWSGLLVISLGLAFPYVWWRRRGVRYEITDSRIIRHTGRISSKTNEFQLNQIRRVKTHQRFGDRIGGTGTITIDTGTDEMKMKSVPKYEKVADAIRNAIE